MVRIRTVLYDIIYPIQAKLVGRPFVVFTQACRSQFNEHLADENMPNIRCHTMKDTYFMYSSPLGNRSWRPLSRDEPSIFIKILADKFFRVRVPHILDYPNCYSVSSYIRNFNPNCSIILKIIITFK